MIGLAFLNLLGTILFFGFILMAVKSIFSKMNYANTGNCSSWEKHEYKTQAHSQKPQAQDEAMQVARERLANSELEPKAFEAIKESLRKSEADVNDTYRRNDSALNTARMRLAKGELSAKEFEAVRQALS